MRQHRSCARILIHECLPSECQGYGPSRLVKYTWYTHTGMLLTQIYLTAIYTTACCACEQNDQLRRPPCTREGFRCVRLCPRSWTLDSEPTDETFLNSGSRELLVLNRWDLYVRMLYCGINFPLSCTSIRTSSWEYVTALDFELDMIRGRRSYRWTIWVCSDKHFFACRYLSFEIRADLLIR
jgi:hypothetical protein